MVFNIGDLHVKGRKWKVGKGRSRARDRKGSETERERKGGEGEEREGSSLRIKKLFPRP